MGQKRGVKGEGEESGRKKCTDKKEREEIGKGAVARREE